ncbi:MAG: SMP-30/gluconolactonase/LRE family protein [Rhodospirillaceae bacterium]|nr:SMP-30/gluconolactonase/LRE family protein [Rhodospirillales bacterium]
MMNKTVAACLIAACLSAPALAAEPVKVWETPGFANPESVLWDGAKKGLYVSNINGGPGDKDGNGYISKLNAEGKVVVEKWATGLDAPKGMALFKGRLYVSDIDRLVVIDTATGKVTKTYPAPGAKFLNDVTVDDKGVVYVSDMLDNVIWALNGGKFDKWLTDTQLENPNGLKAEQGRLLVASWGPMTGKGFDTAKPGALKAITLPDKMIRDLTPGFGTLDGLEPDGKGGYVVSDWVHGGVFSVSRQGKAAKLLTLGQGSADIGVLPEQKLLLVPMMMDGVVAAYRLP